MKKGHAAATLLLFSITCQVSGNNYPLGARAGGLANASVTLSDLWSVNHNPAGIAFLKKPSAGIYCENRFLLKELNLKAAAAAYPSKQGAFGLLLSGFGYALYRENKIGISFARPLNKDFAAGIQLEYFNLSIAEYGKKSLLVAAIGIQGKLFKGLFIGVHLFNLTRAKITSVHEEYLPSMIRLGFQYLFSKKLFLAAEIQKSILQKAELRTGLEYAPTEIIFIRAGISTNPQLSTFGFGIRVKQWKFDLSSSYHSILGITPTIGLSYEAK